MRKKVLQRLWVVSLLAPTGLGAAGNASRIAEAVRDRDQAAVTALLEQHVDVNGPLADGTTALHWAVYWNDLSATDRLIRAGAKVNAANRYGATPLWMACTDGNADMVETLLKAGANPNLAAIGGAPVLTAAARAGNVETVKALLAHGADVNAKEARHGQTALMVAVGDRDPHPEVAQMLLEHGADVSIRSKGGFTALLFAVRQGDLQSTQLLVKAGANVHEKGPDTVSLLTRAITNDHYEVAIFLLENGADANEASEPYYRAPRPSETISEGGLKPGFTPLHAAVYRRGRSRGSASTDARSFALLKALLAHGANTNARTPSVPAPVPFQHNPQPAITWVEIGGVMPFWIAATTLDVEAMQFLVASGADPRLRSMENTTPLMVAAGLGSRTRGPSGALGRRGAVNLEALKLLLEWGNDINAVNDHGQTALHGAAFAAAHEAVQLLVDRGARVDVKDALGRRPLEVADDNRNDEYRPALQGYNPADVEKTWELLHKLTPS